MSVRHHRCRAPVRDILTPGPSPSRRRSPAPPTMLSVFGKLAFRSPDLTYRHAAASRFRFDVAMMIRLVRRAEALATDRTSSARARGGNPGANSAQRLAAMCW